MATRRRGGSAAGDSGLGFAVRSIVVAWFALIFLRAPLLLRLAGPLLDRAIRAGIPAGPNVLLTVRGRTSGRERTTPVALLELPLGRFVQSSFGDTGWARNLRAGGEATVIALGRARPVHASELDPELAAPILREALAGNPRSVLVRRIVGPIERPPAAVLHFFRLRVDTTLAEYVAEARRHPVFELRPVDAPGAD
jgi:deazaflavin-dependent oxidoreductase (nitroreductase family)